MNVLHDIPYNFLIGGDGSIYEGRGFTFEGEIVSNRSISSFSDLGIIVAFIGTFSNVGLSELQSEVFFTFINESMKDGNIISNHILLLQDQLARGDIPADRLLDLVKSSSKFRSRKKNFFRLISNF